MAFVAPAPPRRVARLGPPADRVLGQEREGQQRVAAAKLGTTHSQVREVAAWLGALADAMEHRADPAQKPDPVRAAADRAEARAKNTAAPANGLDHLEIPAELRRT